LYYAQIAAVEGSAGREHTDPQLLISLWLYAYAAGSVRRANWRGSANTNGLPVAVRFADCESPHFVGVRSDNKTALDDLFTQVLGMLSAEGLITLERVTLDAQN